MIAFRMKDRRLLFFFSFFFFHFKDEVKESKSRVEFAKTKVVRITIESICTLRDLIREIK